MTGRWYVSQTRDMKRAFALVNAAEVVVILTIAAAIRLGIRPLPIAPPDVDMTLPPSITPEPAATPAIIELGGPVVTSGVPLPVADTLASDSTMASQNRLNAGDLIDPRLKLNPNAIIKVLPETATRQTNPGPEKPEIPKPTDYVRTLQRPEVVYVPTPEYPSHCHVLGIEGAAAIQMLLDLDGSVMDVRVAKTAGNAELDSAAVHAARQAKFTPAIGAHRRPVHVWVGLSFVFRLDR